MGILRQSDYADIQRIGIPRALLYYRYGTLWEVFFRELGCEVVLSRETDRAIVATGESVSVDECCLASKVYLGHAESLIGTCDALFIPSIENTNHNQGFCTKFQALPDLVANTFREQHIRVASCLISDPQEKLVEKDAYLNLAYRFGINPRKAKHAWKLAKRAQTHADHAAATAQEHLVSSLKEKCRTGEALGILLVAHSYLAHDTYLGNSLVEPLERMGATVLFADETDREHTLKASFEFSETLPWVVNRELIGSITLLHEHIDGIILLSAFPCGPDSMTDDAIMRCIQGKPILNLTIDGQSGTAGLETRIESFVDILRYQKKGGYTHD